MRRTNYMKRAALRFLDGTKYKIPVEAVEAGLRTLGDWTDFLAEEREVEMQSELERRNQRRTSTRLN
jgi:hypothetical protein